MILKPIILKMRITNFNVYAINDNGFVSGIIHTVANFKSVVGNPEAILESIDNIIKMLENFKDV